MKLKQVLAVMLSSVMVLSAAPTEVFAFDDPGFLTDSSGGTADEGSEQLENGNASVASSEADGIFDEGTAQECRCSGRWKCGAGRYLRCSV